MIIRPSLLALIARFWVPLILACAYAAWKGGKPERIAAVLVLLAVVATPIVRVGFAQRYTMVQPSVAIIDGVLFVALVVLTIFANRWWPVLFTGLHAIPLLGHFAKWLNPNIPRLAYAIILEAPQSPIIIILFVATWRHQQRLKRWGVDADWRRSSDRDQTRHGSRPVS